MKILHQCSSHQAMTCGIAGDYDVHDVITPEAYAGHAKQWRALGADVIGGCCAIGPEHIRQAVK